jgi:hypothetical protein
MRDGTTDKVWSPARPYESDNEETCVMIYEMNHPTESGVLPFPGIPYKNIGP